MQCSHDGTVRRTVRVCVQCPSMCPAFVRSMFDVCPPDGESQTQRRTVRRAVRRREGVTTEAMRRSPHIENLRGPNQTLTHGFDFKLLINPRISILYLPLYIASYFYISALQTDKLHTPIHGKEGDFREGTFYCEMFSDGQLVN